MDTRTAGSDGRGEGPMGVCVTTDLTHTMHINVRNDRPVVQLKRDCKVLHRRDLKASTRQ